MAECSLSTGKYLRAARLRQVHHKRAGNDQRLLVCQRRRSCRLRAPPRFHAGRLRPRSRLRPGRSRGLAPSRINPSSPASTRTPVPRRARSSSPAADSSATRDKARPQRRSPARPALAIRCAPRIPRPQAVCRRRARSRRACCGRSSRSSPAQPRESAYRRASASAPARPLVLRAALACFLPSERREVRRPAADPTVSSTQLMRL